MELYNEIINGIKTNIPSNFSIENYLHTLQNPVKELRIAYRNSPVNVQYGRKEIQEAYLLTYLPHYYQLIYKIFIEEVPEIFNDDEDIYLTFIGGGPGSEAYGAIKYILNNCKSAKNIYVSILDINASTWEYSHKIVNENLIESINNKNVKIHWKSVFFNLISLDEIKRAKGIINKSHLLVIQNCLNEIANENNDILNLHIKLLFDYLPNFGFLLMSDMTSSARLIIRQLEEFLIKNCDIKFIKSTLKSTNSSSLISVHHPPSEIIIKNLLNGTNNLMPRKNINYDYSIMNKFLKEDIKDQLSLGFNAIYKPLNFAKLDANDYIHKKTFVGIDFGTSSSVISIAYLAENKIVVKTIPIKQKNHLGNTTTSPLVPSIISLVNRKILIGKYAAEYKPHLEYGKNTWHSFKQNLSNFDQILYPQSDLRKNPNFQISNGKEALTLFFCFLKNRLFDYLHENKLSESVEYSIGIPASFPSKQKNLLKECFTNADINCDESSFFEEPNAALINYLFEKNISLNKNSSKHILILDFGAGTVDISTIFIENSIDGITSKLLSVVREGNIGGNKIDELIANLIIKNANIPNIENQALKIELNSLSEHLKILLCKEIITDSQVQFNLPDLCNSDFRKTIKATENLKSIGLYDLSISFKEFNRIMGQYWEDPNGSNIKSSIDKAIINSQVESTSFNLIIITGGGGRNPFLKNYVANYFTNSEIYISDNIQEQVARGAALQSFVLNSFGKNIITPILGHDIYLKGSNKEVKLFKNGISIPSSEIEIEIFKSLDLQIIVCQSYDNIEFKKYFLIPSDLSVHKIILYLDYNQELVCEIISNDSEQKAEEIFVLDSIKLIKLK
ncbi:MAG: Hsp70 family protein [bacterium]